MFEEALGQRRDHLSHLGANLGASCGYFITACNTAVESVVI